MFTPKVVVEDDQMIPVMMMIFLLVVPHLVGVEAMVVEEEAEEEVEEEVQEEVEEEREVILSIVGAKNVGRQLGDRMGSMGDDRIKLMVNLWFC